MRLLIAAVGRLKDKGEIDLVQRYVERVAGAGRAVATGPLSVVEIPESRAASVSARQSDESTRLLSVARSCDRLVLMDETGRSFDSVGFARWLAAERDSGVRELAFLIGGPDGHGQQAQTSAHLSISLSPMTLPHGLARAMLAEQIYRAITISSGHPYHRV